MTQNVPHVTALDLFNNGIDYEVVVLKQDRNNGDVYFIRTDYLDEIDYQRIGQILTRRDAGRMEAWDLFSGITLGNGMNALEYFHQFVKVKTRSGEIMAPNPRRQGSAAPKLLNAQSFAQAAAQNRANAANETATQQAAAPKKAGRPPKQDKQ